MEKKSTEISLPSIEEIKKLMEFPGKIRGTSFKGDLVYILEKKGKKGLKAVEEETRKLGYPIGYRKIKETEWYPVGLRMVSFYALIKAFGWGKKEFIELAESAPKISFIIRLFMRYFVSSEKAFRTAPRIWKRYYNAGEVEAGSFSKNKKGGCAILRVRDFKLHPFYCFFLGHFFVGVFKLTESGVKEITVEETKCAFFKKDNFHEYLIKWIYQ